MGVKQFMVGMFRSTGNDDDSLHAKQMESGQTVVAGVAPVPDAVNSPTTAREAIVELKDANAGTEEPTFPEGRAVGRFDTLAAIRETRRNEAKQAIASFYGRTQPPLLFYGQSEKVVKMSAEDIGDPANWFIIGDIHGDYFALRNAVEHISNLCPSFRLIFLGDLVDRGPHPMECLWYILGLAKEYPQRILWIAGNHDIGVFQDPTSSSFRSVVSPSEFLDHLNQEDSWLPFRMRFGAEFIELVEGLPRAVLLPDGLLITHGGFPHTDLQSELTSCVTHEEKCAWLNSPRCLHDFTWTRITRYPSRIPNRAASGCSYGFKNFEAFCVATQNFFPTARLVTGHDHPLGGFDRHPEWVKNPALTLTGFAFHQDYEDSDAFNDRYQDYLVIGRCRWNDIPEVIQICVNRIDLAAFHAAEIAKPSRGDVQAI